MTERTGPADPSYTAPVVSAEIADALQAALARHQAGRLDQAEAIYRQILGHAPDDPDALHLLGMVMHARGEHEAALDLIGRALRVVADSAALHNNFAQVLRALGRVNEASEAYRRAIALDPDHAAAHNNLGAALQAQGRMNEAFSCYLTAAAIAPAYAVAHYNMGGLLQAQGKLAESVPHYQKALAIEPRYIQANTALGGVLAALGRAADALACFRRVLEIEPDNRIARHMVAALAGEPAERAPDQYVVNVFDSYADHFDAHLSQVLKCDVPQRLAQLLAARRDAAQARCNVLDLGCGTGLMGVALAPLFPIAARMVGVDLSPRMLEQARRRNLYARLVEADLAGMLKAETAAGFDVVTAADVFVYVGKLDEVTAEIKRVLRPGGLFAFSVETFDAGAETESTRGYRLNPSGRFAHTLEYADRLAAQCGFAVLDMATAPLRVEHGLPLQGLLALWQKLEP